MSIKMTKHLVLKNIYHAFHIFVTGACMNFYHAIHCFLPPLIFTVFKRICGLCEGAPAMSGCARIKHITILSGEFVKL